MKQLPSLESEDTWFTTDWIGKKKHKGEDFAVASIGPAGRNLRGASPVYKTPSLLILGTGVARPGSGNGE